MLRHWLIVVSLLVIGWVDIQPAAGVPQSPPTSPSVAETSRVTSSLGMQLTLIPAGEFMLGNPSIDTSAARLQAYYDRSRANAISLGGTTARDLQYEQPQHRVRITRPLYLAAALPRLLSCHRRPVSPVRRSIGLSNRSGNVGLARARIRPRVGSSFPIGTDIARLAQNRL